MTLDTAINDFSSDQLKARMKKMAAQVNFHLYLKAALRPPLVIRCLKDGTYLSNKNLSSLLNFLIYRANKLVPTAVISKSWRNSKGPASRG